MNVTIIETPLTLDIHGLQDRAANKDYAGVAFRLSDRMWKIVKSAGLKNEGKNIWVYEAGDMVFAGVEMSEMPPPGTGLQEKKITLTKYAYYKHIGPYQLISQTGRQMGDEIKRMGLQTGLPYIEIYGHWQPDETKLETELIMALV